MKYQKVYKETLLGDGLIVYSFKIEKQNNTDKNKFRIELMKLDMLGKMITGEDLKLTDKFDSDISGKEKPGDERVLLQSKFEIV